MRLNLVIAVILSLFGASGGNLSAASGDATRPASSLDATIDGGITVMGDSASVVLINLAHRCNVAYSVEGLSTAANALSSAHINLDFANPTVRQVFEEVCKQTGRFRLEDSDGVANLIDVQLPDGDRWPLNKRIPRANVNSTRVAFPLYLQKMCPLITGDPGYLTDGEVDFSVPGGKLRLRSIRLDANDVNIRELLNKFCSASRTDGAEIIGWTAVERGDGKVVVETVPLVRMPGFGREQPTTHGGDADRFN